MGFLGLVLVPSERSTARGFEGRLTLDGQQTGRRVAVIEGAWSYRYPAASAKLYQAGSRACKAVREIALEGEIRLCARYRRTQRRRQEVARGDCCDRTEMGSFCGPRPPCRVRGLIARRTALGQDRPQAALHPMTSLFERPPQVKGRPLRAVADATRPCTARRSRKNGILRINAQRGRNASGRNARRTRLG